MSLQGSRGGGSGSGGAAFRFRTPPDIFIGTDLAAARTARDAASGIPAASDDLAQFDADPTLTIILRVGSSDTYESRRGGAWVVNTNAIAGATGPEGPPGVGVSEARVQELIDATDLSRGMPVYLSLSPTYSAADNRISEIALANAPVPSLTYLRLPAAMGRKTDDLTLMLGTNSLSLVDILGTNVAAAQLTPSALVSVLWLSGEARLTEPLPVRLDRNIKVAISADTVLTVAEINAGMASFTNEIALPTWGQGALRYVFIGVPTNEPDITDIRAGGFSSFGAYQAVAGEVDGFMWWRSIDDQDGEFLSGTVYTLTF